MLNKILKSVTAFTLMLPLVVGPSVSFAKSDISYDEAKETAKETAKAMIEKYGVTSVQYALTDNGKVIISEQVGTNKNGQTNNMYGIASVSKNFTAVAVMQLAQQGKINLDKPIIQYIPEFEMKDSRYKKITVRMLLNHSSGIMGSTSKNNVLFSGKYESPYNALLSELKNATLKADPGKFSTYCNDGYTLAELLVQRVSGMSFSDYIKKYISEPLDLQNTKTPADNFDKDKLAKIYSVGSDAQVPYERVNTIGNGGMYSSAEDLCRYAQIFMNQSDHKILSEESVKAMSKPEYKNGLWPEEDYSMESYGLGWDEVDMSDFEQYGIKALYKGGDTQFYQSTLLVLPEKNIVMTVVSTGGNSMIDKLMAKNVLISLLKEKGIIKKVVADKEFKAPVAANMPEALMEYAGVYENNNELFKIKISKDGKMSILKNPDTNKKEDILTYSSDGKFYSPDGSSYYVFAKRSGITYLYYQSYTKAPLLGQVRQAGYLAQKVLDNSISKETQAEWEKRNGKRYFVCDEQYNSQLYVFNSSVEIALSKTVKGYCNFGAILDKSTAKNMVEIPGAMGRDLYELNFYKIGNTEYLNLGGTRLISEDSMEVLPSIKEFTVKISGSDSAKWYKIDKKSANKILKINLQQNASFAVYNSDGKIINYSLTSKETTTKLPINGYIVFVGNNASKFDAVFK